MAENKRILNLHEQKFVELDVFQANTNASLKNLETQVRQLAQTLQNQSRDSFPSDTKKNPKDCMAITLRSGKELQVKKEDEKRQTEEEAEKEDQNHTTSEEGQERTEKVYESQKLKGQAEMQTKKTFQKEKEEVRVYHPPIPFPQRLKQTKLDDPFSEF